MISCATFTLESDTTIVYLTKPEPNEEINKTAHDIKIFDFWDESFDTTSNSIQGQPLTISGTEIIGGDNEGLCFPICFPVCFSSPLCKKFSDIWAMSNNHDEVTITGLGDCMDGVYIIENFTFNTIKGYPFALKWELTLEFVRELS